jgi:2-polyprenyl-3-methyl-5-hydroxy-6-metoxy-1,4-benzoquinol methylase
MADSEEQDVWENESIRAWKNDQHYVKFAQVIQELLKKILPEKAEILDCGCGIGKHVRAFAILGYNVTGIDQSKNAINYAVTLNSDMPNVNLHNIRLQELDQLGKDRFDLIHTCAVLQHSKLHRQEEILKKFVDALLPGSYYLCAECTLPNGTPTNGYSYPLKEYIEFMDKNGFTLVKTIPPWPYYLWRVKK